MLEWTYNSHKRRWEAVREEWLGVVERCWPGSLETTAWAAPRSAEHQRLTSPHVFNTREAAQEWCKNTIEHQIRKAHRLNAHR